MKRVVFMGTPTFAIPTLEGLHRSAYRVVGVYTQPDRPAGRGRRLAAPPVKQWVLEHGLRVFQPPTLRSPEAVAELRALEPDAIVVAAYGLLLRPAVLEIPLYGCLNLHPSLLPRHRGASPIAGALLAGDEETGVTVMLMDAGMDTGPILAQARLPIRPQDTAGSLEQALAHEGAKLLLATLLRWFAGEIRPQPQDAALATLTRPLRKEEAALDWERPAMELWRRVRAYHPWPGAYTHRRGRRLLILQAEPLEAPPQAPPGTVVSDPLPDGAEGLAVQTGSGLLRLLRLQLEGKQPLDAATFLQGQRDFLGERLG